MPTLPTLTVTTAQMDRLLETFSDSVHPTTGVVMTPTQAYRAWLHRQLVSHVLAQEAIRLDEEAAAVKREALDRLAATMPAGID